MYSLYSYPRYQSHSLFSFILALWIDLIKFDPILTLYSELYCDLCSVEGSEGRIQSSCIGSFWVLKYCLAFEWIVAASVGSRQIY